MYDMDPRDPWETSDYVRLAFGVALMIVVGVLVAVML